MELTKTDKQFIDKNMDDIKIEETGFPKYQWSAFLKNGRDQQFVIRSNDWKEFQELKRNIDEVFEKYEKEAREKQDAFTHKIGEALSSLRPAEATPSAVQSPTAPTTLFCGNHPSTLMVLHPAGISKSTNKPYPAFWACPMKDENGKFCNWKPDMVKKGTQ